MMKQLLFLFYIWNASAGELTLRPVASGDQSETCTICFDTSSYTNETKVMLPCDPKHQFHRPCIHQWLAVRNACPLCKTIVDPRQPQFSLASRILARLEQRQSYSSQDELIPDLSAPIAIGGSVLFIALYIAQFYTLLNI